MTEISPVLQRLWTFCGVSQCKRGKAKVHAVTLNKGSVKNKIPFLIKGLFILFFRHVSNQILSHLVSSLHLASPIQQVSSRWRKHGMVVVSFMREKEEGQKSVLNGQAGERESVSVRGHCWSREGNEAEL